jgi:LmbE family N-acetylglucosaminyl deacetylase
MKKMLITIAHPSDEAFMFGGTIVKYANDGWDIQLICATNGEKGSSGALTWASGDALGALRQDELAKAQAILGLTSVKFLGHKDRKLKILTPGTLEDPICDYMMEFNPDVVLTFDTIGINNDPDHIKVSYATTFAFQKYCTYLESLKQPGYTTKGRGKLWKLDEFTRAFSDTEGVEKEPKLYYACFPEHVMKYLQKAGLFYEESFDAPWHGVNDKFITTVIDIEKEREQKEQALQSHESQREDIDKFIAFPNNPLMKQEYFMLRMQSIHEVFMGKTDQIASTL